MEQWLATSITYQIACIARYYIKVVDYLARINSSSNDLLVVAPQPLRRGDSLKKCHFFKTLYMAYRALWGLSTHTIALI